MITRQIASTISLIGNYFSWYCTTMCMVTSSLRAFSPIFGSNMHKAVPQVLALSGEYVNVITYSCIFVFTKTSTC